MKTVLWLFIWYALSLAPAHADEPDPYGGNSSNLLLACNSPKRPNLEAYCIGYLKAYRDWYWALNSWRNQILDSTLRYCEPKGFDYRVMKDAVVDYLETHPDVLDKPRIIGVSQALHHRWPCPTTDTESLQRQLSRLGYFPIDRITGNMDSRTTSAIALFQKDNGLPVTGQPDATLIRVINEKLKEHYPDARRQGSR